MKHFEAEEIGSFHRKSRQVARVQCAEAIFSELWLQRCIPDCNCTVLMSEWWRVQEWIVRTGRIVLRVGCRRRRCEMRSSGIGQPRVPGPHIFFVYYKSYNAQATQTQHHQQQHPQEAKHKQEQKCVYSTPERAERSPCSSSSRTVQMQMLVPVRARFARFRLSAASMSLSHGPLNLYSQMKRGNSACSVPEPLPPSTFLIYLFLCLSYRFAYSCALTQTIAAVIVAVGTL